MNALLSIGTIVGAVLLLFLVTATVAAALLDVYVSDGTAARNARPAGRWTGHRHPRRP